MDVSATLGAFTKDQVQAVALTLIGRASLCLDIFFGLTILVLGWLIFRSSFLSRLLGIVKTKNQDWGRSMITGNHLICWTGVGARIPKIIFAGIPRSAHAMAEQDESKTAVSVGGRRYQWWDLARTAASRPSPH